ncbi:hypothetical protein GCM10025331_55820 [Actinoplanes utahensis]|nr:hypothetical protein Aut01nite_63400 [Actinoplanes utahensis]
MCANEHQISEKITITPGGGVRSTVVGDAFMCSLQDRSVAGQAAGASCSVATASAGRSESGSQGGREGMADMASSSHAVRSVATGRAS